MSDTGIITQVYTQVNGWKEMEQKVKAFLEEVGEKDLDAVLEKMKDLEEKNKNLEKEKKELEKDIEGLYEDNEELEERIEYWESEYGNRKYVQTKEDNEFYEKLENYPENNCKQLLTKLKVVADRIAEKLGDSAYVEENDGAIFTDFETHGELSREGSRDMDLTPREKKMIKKELEHYSDLDYKWRQIWWD